MREPAEPYNVLAIGLLAVVVLYLVTRPSSAAASSSSAPPPLLNGAAPLAAGSVLGFPWARPRAPYSGPDLY